MLAAYVASTTYRFAIIVAAEVLCAVVMLIYITHRLNKKNAELVERLNNKTSTLIKEIEESVDKIRLSVAGHQLNVITLITEAKEQLLGVFADNEKIHREIQEKLNRILVDTGGTDASNVENTVTGTTSTSTEDVVNRSNPIGQLPKGASINPESPDI
jgi:hypothetical protein